MNKRHMLLAIFIVSVLVIAGAWAFQFAGYAPCPLCLKQRWAWYGAIPLSLAFAWIAPRNQSAARLGLVLLGLIFVVSAIFGAYHAGVEWKWWPGPGTCSGALTGELPELTDEPVVSCEDAAIRILGLSLAGWNAVISAALVVLALVSARKA